MIMKLVVSSRRVTYVSDIYILDLWELP
jgi:hypothetical protein